MARLTLEEFYTYMKGAPRTRGWGALLVYDRQKANLLLMQEHILRADKKAWIEPVSGEKVTENGKTSRLSNFTFGAPVLSFENANIGSSRAALSMPVVGGKLTEWAREAGAELPTLVGISNLNPLTAPRVKMNIKLTEGAGGIVDEDGRVYLDLADSSSYYFEVSQWRELNIKLGELIEEKFKDPARGEQVWELNRMSPMEGDMKPTQFRVRTHSLARAGSKVASTKQADLEEGAILVGVALNGGSIGDFPDEDNLMPYLLPARKTGGAYSAGIILSSQAWVQAAVKSLFDSIAGTGYESVPIVYEKDSSGFFKRATGGGFRISRVYKLIDESDHYFTVNVFGVLGHLSFAVAEGGLVGKWSCDAEIGSIEIGMRINGRWEVYKYDLSMEGGADFFMETYMDGGVLRLRSTQGIVMKIKWNIGSAEHEGARASFESDVEEYIKSIISRISGRVNVIDYWRMNALLFREGQRTVPDTFASPGDVLMLGELAPTLTAFAIDPIETSLTAEGTQKLTLTPRPQPGDKVTWEVKALPDDPEKPVGAAQLGEIVNEVYKAPKAETISGTFRQVIITATVGDNSSSALFTVVPSAVAVRPNLLNALYSNDQNAQRYVLEGGSVGSELVWTKGPGFKGELRDPTPAEYSELNIPRDRNVKVYVAPKRAPDSGPVLGALMQLDQVQVSGGGRTETIDITVLWGPAAATLKVAAQGSALQLVLAVQGWGGAPVDLPPDQTKWFVAKGKGNLDEAKGIYQPAADEGDYVIIAGVGMATGAWNYVVLPMPYTAEDALVLEEVTKALRPLQVETVEYTAEQIEAMEGVKKAFSVLSTARN
ncbi:hypothetical protein ACNFIC_13940 [Pseudomonas sp. NY15463]|uniref:hypothetical protein n=1 Tax=Pseudomonas sp. NY15463 TaxID=3400361 RepID=UPI003A886EFF